MKRELIRTRRWRFVLSTQYLVLFGVAVLHLALTAHAAPPKLTVGVAQLALEPTLAANRDKITAFIRQAKDRGCRVVVFPETALFWPETTTKEQIDAAMEEL